MTPAALKQLENDLWAAIDNRRIAWHKLSAGNT